MNQPLLVIKNSRPSKIFSSLQEMEAETPAVYFSWIPEDGSRKPSAVVVDQLTLRLLVAIAEGKPISVPATLGCPPSGYRGNIYSTCLCGATLHKGRGFAIRNKDGRWYKIDAIALHHVACHRDKLNDVEKQLLESLPDITGSADIQALEQMLRTGYDCIL